MIDNSPIDIVVLWVDGKDPEWIKEFNRYSTDTKKEGIDSREERYRDYGLLKYWFRGVEKYTPWINKIHFVTCGQKPDWLDESNPKLRLVNHRDFIPAEYLPTFQGRPIELNLHRIKDLSEHFVYFNDDLFLLRPVKSDFYFKKGLPVISCDLGIPRWLSYSNIGRIIINNCGVLKQNLDVERLVWKNIWKYINIRSLGFGRAAKNLVSFAINRTVIPGTFGHQPSAQLKSTFDEIWCTVPKIMDDPSRCRFRSDYCVNQWLLSSWNMISGRFYPANEKRTGHYFVFNTDNLSWICETIRMQSYPQLCLNDKAIGPAEMEKCIHEVSQAFDTILPEKSSFEK